MTNYKCFIGCIARWILMIHINALLELFFLCLTASIPCRSFTAKYDFLVVVGQRAHVFLALAFSSLRAELLVWLNALFLPNTSVPLTKSTLVLLWGGIWWHRLFLSRHQSKQKQNRDVVSPQTAWVGGRVGHRGSDLHTPASETFSIS